MESALKQNLSRALASGPPLKLAVLFGSFAKGHPRADSDVDIAVVPEDPGISLSEELALQVALSRACHRDVDLVRLDRASTLVRWQVARHGCPVHEAVAGAFARFRVFATSEYLDFEPSLVEAGERFRRRLAARDEPAP